MSRRRVVPIALALFGAGCALPVEPDPSATAKPQVDAGPPVEAGCRLFEGAPKAPSGAGRSIILPSGALWLFDDVATVLDAGSPCSANSAAIAPLSLDTSALGSDRTATPLDGVSIDGAGVLYLQVFAPDASSAFGVREEGIAVATRPDLASPFVAQTFLWTADRPAFGASVLREDGFLFVYGCRTAGLDSTCSVARVPEGSATDASAYRYDDGGGNWVGDIELAAPLAGGGPTVSVRHDAARSRYLMSSVPALGGDLELRTGLGPAGPWSKAFVVAKCEVPAGAFCVGAVQHPELAAEGEIALTYGVASLSAGAKDPKAYWPRLVTMPWPADLP